MKCLVCGSDMHVIEVESHPSPLVRELEYRIFRCESCGDTERRLASVSKQRSKEVRLAPPLPDGSEEPGAKSILGRIFGSRPPH
jgi:hypothetical protein